MDRSWRRWARGAAAASVVAGLLACGGVSWPGRSSANVEACRAYRDAYNALPCTRADLPASFCPDTLDALGCDATAYYGCLEAAVRCNEENLLDATAQLRCASDCP